MLIYHSSGLPLVRHVRHVRHCGRLNELSLTLNGASGSGGTSQAAGFKTAQHFAFILVE